METNKSRDGTDDTGAATRPYKFTDFDILAVCLQPATNDWSRFVYCCSKDLLPRPENASLIKILQPVSPRTQRGWYTQLEDAIAAFIGPEIETSL